MTQSRANAREKTGPGGSGVRRRRRRRAASVGGKRVEQRLLRGRQRRANLGAGRAEDLLDLLAPVLPGDGVVTPEGFRRLLPLALAVGVEGKP